MKIKQRTEVSMVTHEITVIRSKSASAYCEGCEEITLHLSLAEMFSILAISEDEVIRMAEGGQIHLSVDNAGSLRVCGNSAAALERG